MPFQRPALLRRVAPLLALTVLLSAAQAARAEVIEIAPDGAVTRYNAPGVYTAQGVSPILRSAPAVRAPVRAAAASAPPAMVHAAITRAAERQWLDRDLLEAVAWRESGFRQTALSPKGAVGVMQIMPATAQALGVDRYDLHQNVEGGAAYLRMMLSRYGGNLNLALAAYNAGPGAVDRYGGVPPFRETQAYVGAIVGRLAQRATQPAFASVFNVAP